MSSVNVKLHVIQMKTATAYTIPQTYRNIVAWFVNQSMW